MDTLVLMASALYDEVYYEGGEFPYAKAMACPNCLEVLLDEADKTGQRIFLSTGFYGDWRDPFRNTTDPEIISRSLRAMNLLSEQFGHHSCIEGWYMPGILEENPITPEDDKEAIMKITREDVISAAEKAKLSAVFFLKGGAEE